MEWLHCNVNVLQATELCTLKMVKVANTMLCVFYHSKITLERALTSVSGT